jgi:hypothetical protein
MSGFHPDVLDFLEGYEFYLEHGWSIAKDQPLAVLGSTDPSQKRLHQIPSSPPPEPCIVCGEEEGRTPFKSVIGEGLICENCRRFFEEAEKVEQP